MSDNGTLCHATQAEEPGLCQKKISATISPLTSDRLTSQIAILFIFMCEAQLSKGEEKLRAVPKKN